MIKDICKKVVFFRSYIKKYSVRFILNLILLVVEIVLSIIYPLIWGSILANVTVIKFKQIIFYLILLLATFLLQLFVSSVKNYLMMFINENLSCDMKKDIIQRIMDFPMCRLDQMGNGEVLSRLEGDIDIVVSAFTGQILNLLVNVLKALIIGSISITINWKLSSIIIVTLPLNYYVLNKFGKKIYDCQDSIRRNTDNYYSKTEEVIVGIKDIKTLGIKPVVNSNFCKLINKNKNLNLKLGKVSLTSRAIINGIGNISQLFIYALGIYFVYTGDLKFELFIAVSSYIEMFSNSLLEVAQTNPDLQMALVSMRNIEMILEKNSENNEEFGNLEVQDIKGKITMLNVSFAYNQQVILSNINLTMLANKKYAIIGVSGCGKSTLLNLLLRLYKCNKGNIYIDNYDINEISEQNYSRIITIISQNPILFNMSVADNIRIGRPEASLKEVEKVAEMAYIDKEIELMDNKYDTVISDFGANLSIGQRQRLAIARALLMDTKIIIFDEATSALDSVSQFAIRKAINKLSKNHTVIIVAHRLLNIIDSEQIFVLNSGHIIAHGKSDELLENCEVYRKFYELELKEQESDG